MFHFVVVWLIVQSVTVAPTPNPYTGASSPDDDSHKEKVIRVMYQPFKTKAEADAFAAKAPASARAHMHVEDMGDAFKGDAR